VRRARQDRVAAGVGRGCERPGRAPGRLWLAPRDRSSMVERALPKPDTRVRFPSVAPRSFAVPRQCHSSATGSAERWCVVRTSAHVPQAFSPGLSPLESVGWCGCCPNSQADSAGSIPVARSTLSLACPYVTAGQSHDAYLAIPVTLTSMGHMQPCHAPRWARMGHAASAPDRGRGSGDATTSPDMAVTGSSPSYCLGLSAAVPAELPRGRPRPRAIQAVLRARGARAG
jgi:hypothetical protein